LFRDPPIDIDSGYSAFIDSHAKHGLPNEGLKFREKMNVISIIV
jgi:pentatricopeptide repeat protein